MSSELEVSSKILARFKSNVFEEHVIGEALSLVSHLISVKILVFRYHPPVTLVNKT